jgi:SAM-dependent methyltransferase
MRGILSKILLGFPNLYFFNQLFRQRLKPWTGDLQSAHDLFRLKNVENSVAVDLGCGFEPQNRFFADELFGVDLVGDQSKNILKAKLGFEKLPFNNNSLDYITAYDLLEHIPRYADLAEHGDAPFIFLMNEIYRVIKKGGVFLSHTPIYPYLGAFQDPTHTNIMTADTLRLYFSNEKFNIAEHYGIETNFKILFQRIHGQHLIAVMTK